MEEKEFQLVAEVRSADPSTARAGLPALVPDATIEDTAQGFRVEARMRGKSAGSLNRALLSGLRRLVRRTTLRATWTATDGTQERYFDYVRKDRPPA